MRRAALLVVAALTATACSSTPQDANQDAPPVPQLPNVLVIVTDDHRAEGTMGSMPKTRRFFKRQGTRFSRAFATTPLCCPSRASIFSGRYAHRHGVHYNDLSPELDHDETLQAYLQRAGYRTAVTGKYLNRWPHELDPPYFDDFAIMLQGYYFDALFNVDGDRKEIDGYTNNYIKKSAVRFLERFEDNDAQPWMLYIGATPSHAPYTAEPKYEGASTPRFRSNPAVEEADLSDKPDFGPSKRSNYKKIRRKQLRTLYSADDLVARVMRQVAALDEDRDTLAFFLGDNGQLWGEHGLTAKRYPYLQSVKIPFFARWPGRVEGGATDRRLAANIDVAATVLDVTNLLSGHDVDGKSLFSETKRDKLLMEHWPDDESEVPQWASILTRREQYVEYYRRSGENFVSEYYDLTKDPWQLRNLLGDRKRGNDPDVAALSAELQELRNCAGDTCP